MAIQQVIKKIGMISVHGDFHTLCNDVVVVSYYT